MTIEDIKNLKESEFQDFQKGLDEILTVIEEKGSMVAKAEEMKADLEKFKGETQGYFDTHKKEVEKKVAEIKSVVDKIKVIKGEPGKPGKDAQPLDEEKIVSRLEKKIPKIDEKKIIDEVVKKIPKPKDGEPGKPGKDGKADYGVIKQLFGSGGGVKVLKDGVSFGDQTSGVLNFIGTNVNVDYIREKRFDITFSGGSGGVSTASTPLNISAGNIDLGGLSSYGDAGQVMKVNSTTDGLEWGDAGITSLSGAFLLDQTTPQSVINGVPYIVNGIKTPKIYPNADSTTAIQFNKANGTTNVLNIDTTNGNVGIGTTNPGGALEIISSADNFTNQGFSNNLKLTAQYWPAILLNRTYDNTGYLLGEDGNGFNFMSVASGIGPTRLIVQNGGNVGIGTTAPGALLQVGAGAGYGVTTGFLLSNNLTGSTYDRAYQIAPIQTVSPGANSILMYLLPTINDGVTVPVQYGIVVDAKQGSGTATKYAGITTGALGGTNNTHLLLGSITVPTVNYAIYDATGYQSYLSGNVGIGTTTPGSKLTVSGHIGTLGTIPTLTSAGTGASINTGSTDTAGEITEGTLATGAVITFATAYTNVPFAIVVSEAGLLFSYTVSTTGITITNIGALSSTKLSYQVLAAH